MKRKKPLFALIILLAAYVALEAGSFAVYRVLYGQWFNFERNGHQRQEALAGLEDARTKARRHHDVTGLYSVLHPYLGYVKDPARGNVYNDYFSGDHAVMKKTDPIIATPQGFLGEEDPLVASKDTKKAIVAITGGSVAEDMYLASHATLHRYLDALPEFQNKKVVLITLGMSGYKEPQQALSLMYYLAQGGRLDMLINLDGKNESILGLRSVEADIYPAYPNNWRLFCQDSFNKADFDHMGDIALWARLRHMAASAMQPLRFSVTGSVLWLLADDYLVAQQKKTSAENPAATKEAAPYWASGPSTFAHANSNDIAGFEVTLWEQGTLQMSYLAQKNHFAYFHFLQPSQYLPNSKSLSEVEKKQFYSEGSEDQLTVQKIYPAFLDKIASLRAQGIDVTSLTNIYKNEPETIYADSCCHVNLRGYELIAEAIGAHIAETKKGPHAAAP